MNRTLALPLALPLALRLALPPALPLMPPVAPLDRPGLTTTSPGLLRQVRPEDADAIRAFVCGLSPRSQYFRFFAAVAPPSGALLDALCGRRGNADILVLTDPAGSIIAHAMAADDVTSNVAAGDAGHAVAANIGIVVADEWQGRGIGTMLLSTLVRRATSRGISNLVLDVLPANKRMLGIIGRRWPDAPREHNADSIVIRPAITQPTGPAFEVPAIVPLRGPAA